MQSPPAALAGSRAQPPSRGPPEPGLRVLHLPQPVCPQQPLLGAHRDGAEPGSGPPAAVPPPRARGSAWTRGSRGIPAAPLARAWEDVGDPSPIRLDIAVRSLCRTVDRPKSSVCTTVSGNLIYKNNKMEVVSVPSGFGQRGGHLHLQIGLSLQSA